MRIRAFMLYSAVIVAGCADEPSGPVVIPVPQPEQETAADSVIPPKLEEIGTGLLPDGLSESDLEGIQKLRIQALQNCIGVLQARFEGGLDTPKPLLEAQIDLVNVRIELATTKKERLDAIFECQKQALLVWQRIKELQRVGAKGGDAASEAVARAHVLRIRAMWLKEISSKNP